MKRYPECRRDFYDDSLHYCLDDGVEMLEGTSPAVLPEPAHRGLRRGRISPTERKAVESLPFRWNYLKWSFGKPN